MFIVFFSGNDVYRAEDLLLEAKIDCKVVPSPVQEKVYCGLCVETSDDRAVSLMEWDMEYVVFDEKLNKIASQVY